MVEVAATAAGAADGAAAETASPNPLSILVISCSTLIPSRAYEETHAIMFNVDNFKSFCKKPWPV